ncbi:hypothetical protein [Flavivirga spongiicola]|uniref:DUF3575 domain-containing protein n=1 Tax=Flavivirga spongiicola TaxID=421621 RepID=A0ABU7XVC0_9FLAO|nr:hypothetical protein [Flavivirga sp. MEBiC05379]MDO5979547.1 hypothetical protein [Flavivirga sp. MEBiC05379]
MKHNTYIYFLTAALILVSYSGFTQDKDISKNHISIDPILPLFGTFQLNYERAFTDDLSFGLSFGYKDSSGLFEVTKINFDRFDSNDLNFSGFKIIPEFRWYFQKSKIGLNGLYTGVYYKYQNASADLGGIYTSINDEISNILIDANLKSSVIGVELGYKWQLKSGFFIDLIFAGPGFSSNQIELTEIEPVPEAFYDDLTEALRDIGIIDFIDPDFEVNGNQKTKITLPAWRYGIKFGYSF